MRARAAQLLCTTMLSQATRGIAEVFDLGLWSDWFAQLDREFIFLLVLPFVVAVIGLWAAYLHRDED